MDTRDDSMVDTLAEKLRLMDIWIDDMEMGMKELVEEREFEVDVDEEMADLYNICVRLGVEDMLHDGAFGWGEE